MNRDGGEQKSDQHQQAEKGFQPADFQDSILVTHNLVHLDPRAMMFRTFGAPGSLMHLNHALTDVAIEWRPFGPWITFHFTSLQTFPSIPQPSPRTRPARRGVYYWRR